MKTLKSFIIMLLFVAAIPVTTAQTAEEIIANYLENIGGEENFKALKGVKISGNVKVQGMDLTLSIVQLTNGKQMSAVELQGKEIKQGVFDGEVLWNTNFMTMKAEAADAETLANFKLGLNDFPDPFIDYKEKGYLVELIGKETVEGTETFKIMLTKEPITVDGKETADISYYFFDSENFVPIVVEAAVNSGPAKGMVSQTKFSDYQEVDGLYFPFSTTAGVKDQPGAQSITFTKIELNPTVDDSIFKMPVEVTTTEEK